MSPTMINVNSMVQKAMPARRLTEGLTWMSTAINVGSSAGAAVAGRLVDDFGYSGGFNTVITCAWSMVVITLVAIPVLRATSGKKRARLPVELRSRRLGLGRIWRRQTERKSIVDDLEG